MKRRSLTGVLAGGLMAAMLPGVASAERGPPMFNTGQCLKEGVFAALDPSAGTGPVVVFSLGHSVGPQPHSPVFDFGVGCGPIPPA